MRHTRLVAVAVGLGALTYIGCRTEAPTASDQVPQSSFASSEWSDPVNLGESINSLGSDQNATLSKDGLSLYLSSNRTDLAGAQGSLDIWVSQRRTTAEAWGTPLNLGSVINTSGAELSPNLSVDGHLMFFTSNRIGSTPVPGTSPAVPSIDIWMSRRTNIQDDFSWGPAVRLGPGVNTGSADQAPMYLQSAEDGTTNFYFNRGILADNQGDIYSASITPDGGTLGPAELVVALNSAVNDAAVSIRRDGREIFFWSLRPAGLTGQDLWTSTRQSVHHPWSPPTKLDAPLNTSVNELTPSLSFDGRTLIFASNRAAPTSATGGIDLWVSTRTPSGE
jgi:hypothetical protein